MKNQNMRDLQKRWAEDRRKAEKKAKAAVKKPETAAPTTDSAKSPAK